MQTLNILGGFYTVAAGVIYAVYLVRLRTARRNY
jgi:hypothetical protein